LVETFKKKVMQQEESKDIFTSLTVDQMIQEAEKKDGIKWRLNCLNRNLGPLNCGTLGHVFARVESGKTSFLCSEVSAFIKQLKDNERILWFCNEERGSAVISRFNHALLGKSRDELLMMYKLGKQEEIEQLRKEAGFDKILFKHDTALSFEQIQDILNLHMGDYTARIIVVDIADHVRYRGDSDLASHQRLGELYRRYRELASKFNCDVITAGQASAEVQGRKVLESDDMHNSKTDKPGALDYAIGIGKSNQEEDRYLRWISLPKNKMGQTIEEITTVRFDIPHSRFIDID
jgi:replicative DNA helicase